jgi:hypothetical protein
MTSNKIYSFLLLFALSIFVAACYTTKPEDTPFFPCAYPGKAESYISGNHLSLSNQALKAEWSIGNSTIQLKQVTNKYDKQTVDLSNIILFAITLENGEQLTNHDFFIQNKPIVSDIAATDSLPTAALRFAGKEISALITEKNGNITIKWTAQLRDGSTYIRQNIEIKVAKEPVKIKRVTFFDGVLEGAEYTGLVLGSPIQYINFFFGLEHPIAHIKALLARNIGGITQKSIDVSGLIDAPGEYTVSVEHGGGSANYNVESVALFEDGKLLASDKHPLNGKNGNSFYRLKVDEYNASNKHHIKPQIKNIKFGGSNPAYLPDMEAGTRLIKTLRQHNPDVYVNITVGSWPSPFWLKYADCTWRGSGDLHMAGEGSRIQKFMTCRDGTLYNNIVKKAPYYPLNSIMTVGIAYANLGHPIKCINDSLSDFSDMVWSFFGAGSSLQELYISHDRMKPEFWPILAKAATWSKENEDILKDTHWIGGSPINLEVYGFASWTPEKGIVMLRNPSSQSKTFKKSLDEILELPLGFSGEYLLTPVYGNDSMLITIENSISFEVNLKPFETRIYEISKNNK